MTNLQGHSRVLIGKKPDQHSVHWTAGTHRVLLAFSELQEVSISEPFSPQPPVTRAVGRYIKDD